MARLAALGSPEGGSAPAIARALHVSVRTLQRRLVIGGTTFRELSEGVRIRQERMALRLDYGFRQVDSGLYISVGEAF
jgi:AraC-like DNA-binding protein